VAAIWEPALFNPSLGAPDVRIWSPNTLQTVGGGGGDVDSLPSLDGNEVNHRTGWCPHGELERYGVILGSDTLDMGATRIQAQAET